jgi:hypothetical protein
MVFACSNKVKSESLGLREEEAAEAEGGAGEGDGDPRRSVRQRDDNKIKWEANSLTQRDFPPPMSPRKKKE